MQLKQYQWNPETDFIANGAFAEVFKATDAGGGQFALKIYTDAIGKDTGGGSLKNKYTLEKEFEKGKHLSHTNVLRYIDLDYIKHTDHMNRMSSFPVLIMEYADAGSLEGRIRSAFPQDHTSNGETIMAFQENEVQTIAKQILMGLSYLHDQGIIHRDLKPANILFKTDRLGRNVAKISDFGISRDLLDDVAATQVNSSTTGVGTLLYMAPEQFRKKTFGLEGTLSNRIDIWAFGVIFYRMLTGRLPFGSNTGEYEVVQEEITSKEPDYSRIPDAYRAVIKGCLAKHAEKRLPDADAVLRLLNVNVENSSDGGFKPSKKWIYGGIGAVLLVVISVFGYLAVSKKNDKENPSGHTTTITVPDDSSGANLSKQDVNKPVNNAPRNDNKKILSKQPGSNEQSANDDKILNNTNKTAEDNSNTPEKESYANSQRIVLANGIVIIYTGPLNNRLPNGNGTTRYTNGTVYTGELADGYAQGTGTLTGNNEKYEGSWRAGKRNGQGTQTYSNGDKYIGDWTNDQRSGYGKYYIAGAGRYEGYFEKDSFNGKGTYYNADGSKETGSWINDKKNGLFTAYDKDGKMSKTKYDNGVKVF